MNVGTDLGLNSLKLLIMFLKEFFGTVYFDKVMQYVRRQQKLEKLPFMQQFNGLPDCIIISI